MAIEIDAHGVDVTMRIDQRNFPNGTRNERRYASGCRGHVARLILPTRDALSSQRPCHPRAVT